MYEKFVRKNVDEIDTRGQFHQCFTHAFFVRIFGAKPNVTRENNEKFVPKMLMKLTTGVNFINHLRVHFCTEFWRQKFKPKIKLLYEILVTKTRFRTKNARLKC